MPEKDMDTLETLWQQNSNGRFGFVQQRKIWRKVRGQFDKFAEEVSWFTATWVCIICWWPGGILLSDLSGYTGLKWFEYVEHGLYNWHDTLQKSSFWPTSRRVSDLSATAMSQDTWKNRNWPDEFIYNVEAPVGHLPLTNCIRGAQVLGGKAALLRVGYWIILKYLESNRMDCCNLLWLEVRTCRTCCFTPACS